MSSVKVPSYRKQKRKGKPALAFVEVHGVRRYLGEYGTPDSLQRYRTLTGELDAAGGFLPAADDDLRVVELVERYWAHVKQHYRLPDGAASSETGLIKTAMGLLLTLYADLPAKQFSPLKLKAVRAKMVERGWSRKNINKMISRVKRPFSWGVEEELVPPSVAQGLREVKGLKAGRSDAKETDPIRPAAQHLVDATIPHASPPVAAMIRLQLLTGARPGEIALMRACDIDTKGKVWEYRPARHKTLHHGIERRIYLGPAAQEVVKPSLTPDLQAYLFSPAESEAWHRERRHEARKTPANQGNGVGDQRKRNPRWKPSARFTVGAYRRAIDAAIAAAFPIPEHLRKPLKAARRWIRNNPAPKSVCQDTAELAKWRATHMPKAVLAAVTAAKAWQEAHHWHPNQLRHNAATLLREQHGIDVAQTILGHRIGSAITEIYAEANVTKAKQVMLRIG